MSLAEQVASLRGEVRGHKAAIRHHRAALAAKKAALVALEAECRARGVLLVVVPGEGKTPWPTSRNPSSTSTP